MISLSLKTRASVIINVIKIPGPFAKRNLTKWHSYLFLIGITFFASHSANAQCNLVVDAGPDQVLCTVPATFQLSGTVSDPHLEYSWTPTTGLSDPSSLTPIATINTPTTYTLTAVGIDLNNNLITNGDFSAGNTGFTSDYTYNAAPIFPGNELVEGQYSIGTDPAPMHANWVTCGDHTSGTGNMMLVNGSQVAGQSPWCQMVTVTPNTEYAFSVWVTSVDPNGPCEIQFKINNIPVGAGNVALSATCTWVNFFVLWNSGANTTIEICIEDINTAEFGNDFAIDDIVFAPTCTETDEVFLDLSEVTASADSENALCEGQTLNLSATGGATYNWSGPGFLGTGSAVSFPNVTLLNQGTYTVTVSDINGCTDVASTTLIVFPSYATSDNQFTCDPSNVGITTQNNTTQFGCDSIVTITTSLAPFHNIIVSETTCDSTMAGVETLFLQNEYGCDSTVTITTLLNPSYYIYLTETVCDSADIDTSMLFLFSQLGCDSTIVTEKIYNEADSTFIENFTCDPMMTGTFEEGLFNQNGCDSIIFTETLLIPSDSTLVQDFSCDPTMTGVFLENLFNQYGCDSIVTTQVMLIPPDSTFIQGSSCDSTMTGLFLENLFNQYGCDSIVSTDIVFLIADSTYVQDFSCDPTMTGIFLENLFNTNGCDSIVTTEIMLLTADFTFVQDYSCDPTMTGTFDETLLNQYGCDSMVTTMIMLTPPDSSFVQDFSCDPTMTGIFDITLINQNGCDSIVITEVMLLPPDSTFVQDFSCDPTMTGTFAEMLFNQNGCDSIVTTLISLSPQDTVYLNTETCDTLEVGISSEIMTNQFGCDSLIVTEVTYFSDLQMSFIISQPDCFLNDQGSITVSATGGTAPYLYAINQDEFQSNPAFTELTSGTYQIYVQDDTGCISSDLFIINTITPINLELGENFTITSGDDAILNPIINLPIDSLLSIQWTTVDDDCPTCLNQVVSPIITTSYEIEVMDTNGCVAADEITISVVLKKDIYVPNIISVNGDGQNDKFYIFASDDAIETITSFQGYDRWGNRIWGFQDILPNDENAGWDGRFKGVNVVQGVYIWLAEIKFTDGSNETMVGNVTVIH